MHVIDKDAAQLERASVQIQKLRQVWPISSLPGDGSTWGTTSFAQPDRLGSALRASWLAVECVPEKRSLKRTVLQELDDLAADDVIVASNSSSYAITDLLKDLPLRAPARFASIHSCRSLG